MTVLYGSSVADTTITTACKMTTASGGVETSKLTSWSTGSSVYGEIYSQGTTTAATYPAIQSPSGNGWVYTPGAGTFALGNWSAIVTASGVGGGTDATIRFYKYSGGIYTSIGTIFHSGWPSAKTANSFTATSMPATVFGSSDLLYVDLWFHDSTGAGGDNPTVYESTTSAAGVTSDMQVTTSTFTPFTNDDLGTRLRVQSAANAFFPRAFGSDYISDNLEFPLHYAPRAFGSGYISDNLHYMSRVFGWAILYAWDVLSDTALRLLLVAARLQDVPGRLLLLAVALYNVTTRLILTSGTTTLKNAASRMRLLSQRVADVSSRARLLAVRLRDAENRVRLRAATARDSTSRLHLGGGVGYRNTVINDNPRAYYRLNTSSGTIVPDESGNGYTATLSGVTTPSQPGAVAGDTATLFTTGAASLVLPPALNPSAWSALSLEYWVKLSGAWQHVVLTTDDTTTTLYLNGAVYTPTGGDPVVMDILAYAGSYLPGSLDEVALYAYTLTPEQVRTHFTLGIQDSQEYAPRSFGGNYLSSTLFSLPRSFGSALAFGWGNLVHVATRLVLAGGTATLRDLSTRLRVLVQQPADVASRMRLRVAGIKDATLRLRLLAVLLHDQAGRVRLLSLTSRDAALRLRLFAIRTLDVTARLLLRVIKQADQATRTRLLATVFKDQATRVLLRAVRLQDLSTRLVLRAVQQGNLASRVRLVAIGLRDASLRLRLAIPPKLDQASRLRLLVIKTANDLGARTRLLAVRLRDQASRLRLSALAKKDQAARVLLQTVGLVTKDLVSRLLLRASRLSDQASRLRLQVVGRTLDQTSRTRLLAQSLPNAALLLRLLVSTLKDSATRTRLLALRLRDLSARLRLAIPPKLDSAVRLRLLAITAASTLVTRLLLLSVRLRDQALRLRLRAVGSRDLAARLLLRVIGQTVKDQAARLLLLVVQFQSSTARLRLLAQRLSDTVTRTRLSETVSKGGATRVRLLAQHLLDAVLRVRLLVLAKRDLTARFVLIPSSATLLRDVGYRLSLYDGASTLLLASRDGSLSATTRSSLSSVFSRDGASRVPSR